LAVWERPETVPRYFGQLIPGRRLLFSSTSRVSNPPRVEIGNSGSIFIYGGPAGKPLFDFYGSTLTIETIRGQVKVSTEIKDGEGHLLAELVRNEWRVSPSPNTFDRNYNADTLEVKNAEGQIVLQVKVLADRIQLQCEWRGSNDKGVRLVKSNDPTKPGGFIVIFGPNQKPADAPPIKPLFKYPSDLHFGELL
jgi:hypothetical protein